MRTLIVYTSALVLLGSSAYLCFVKAEVVNNVTSEIVTLVSILCAAVIACLFAVNGAKNMQKRNPSGGAIDFISNYWIRFLVLASSVAFFAIVGKILEWPTVSVSSYDFDLLGFLVLAGLSLLTPMVFVDMPVAIRDIFLLPSQESVGDQVVDYEVPDLV